MKDNMLQAVLQCRLETFRSYGMYSALPNAAYQETKQHAIYSSGVENACCNGIIEIDDQRILSDAEVGEALDFFSMRQLPFIWWTADKSLESKGFQFGGMLTGIALDIAQGLPKKPQTPHLMIKDIHLEEDLKVFFDIVGDSFAMNQRTTEQYLAVNRATMQHGDMHLLAYLDGVPVGTATLSGGSSSAGIWNLATVPAYRKQGIGTALIHAALVEAKKQQYKQVMAILMPKGMAWNSFAKLGFKAVCQFPFYVYGVSSEELEK